MNPTEPGKPALLYLEDHTIFHGRSVGLSGTSGGEICFNTGMTGYQEIFTDPSYFGQLMVTASTHIGNYGTKGSEDESAQLQIAGLVCRQFSQIHSRPSASEGLLERFAREGKVAIDGIDTRAVGMAVVALGGGRQRSSDKLDYSVGLDGIAGLGAKVDEQTPLAMIYANSEESWQHAAQRLKQAFHIGERVSEQHPVIYKHIREATA